MLQLWTCSLIKINPSRDTSESTKSTTCASPLLFIISNIHQKYARNWIRNLQQLSPSLPPPTGGKVVSSTRDESAMINLTGKKRFNATGKSEQSTSDTPYPVLLFSSEMENLPLNISKTAKSEQYVDLTSWNISRYFLFFFFILIKGWLLFYKKDSASKFHGSTLWE